MRHPLSLLVTLLLLPAAALGAEREGTAVGRLLFREGERLYTPGDVRRLVDGELELDLRQGAELARVSLSDDGTFTARGSAGAYRLEYLKVGERAEFFAPQLVDVPEEGSVCVGTLVLSLRDVRSDLGANLESTRVELEDGCAAGAPAQRRVQRGQGLPVRMARPGPEEESDPPKGAIEALLGLRVGWEGVADRSAFRAQYLTAVKGHLFQPFNALLVLTAAQVNRTGRMPRYELGAGVGTSPFWGGIELNVGGAYRLPQGAVPGVPLLDAQARLNFGWAGLGVRGELPLGTDPMAVFVTFDLVPFYIVGAVL